MRKDKDTIFGLRPVIETIESGRPVERIIFKKGLRGVLYHQLVTLAREHEIPFQFVPVERLDRETRKNHQGVIAWVSAIEYQDITNILPSIFESGNDPAILILDSVTDVRNFGAIARTAECFGVNAIVIPSKGSARINADAVKTSAGALNNISVCRTEDLLGTVKYLKESGLNVIVASEKGSISLDKADLSGPVALVLGSEDRGVSGNISRLSDKIVSIPLSGTTGSFNVSVAAGIILYEVTRQRSIKNR